MAFSFSGFAAFRGTAKLARGARPEPDLRALLAVAARGRQNTQITHVAAPV
jgi:hypothetical protein